MGLGRLLKGKKVGKPKVFIARAVLADYESKTPEQVKEWVEAMIKQISTDHPLYRYQKSIFDYVGKDMDFKFRFVLKEFKSCLRVAR